MYLYFDRYGTLKEQITFNPARVGNSNVNKIFVYWEGVEEFPDWAQELALQTRYLLQDNTQYPSATTFGFSAQPETAELPFDKNQDLKYFKYYKEYKFLTIDIPDEVLSYNGAVKSYIWVLNADKKRILGLGVFAFMVDGDINEVIPDENISLAQWNMISAQLGLLSGSVIDVTCDIETNTLKVYYANGLTAIRNLPPNGAQTTISSNFLQEMIFSTDAWVQDGENGYYTYFYSMGVGYNDNRFFVQLERDGKYNSDYYNKTGSFVLSDNIFKGSDGSVLLYSNEPYSGRLLVVGGDLLSGDILVTGLSYNDVNSQLSYKTADGVTHTIYLGIDQKLDISNVAQTTGDSTLKVMSQKAATDNFASLVNGKVPESQLPSYVDDVVEYESKSAFPATGETGKIYVDKSTNLTYRWSGSTYIQVGGGDLNLENGTGTGSLVQKPTTYETILNENVPYMVPYVENVLGYTAPPTSKTEAHATLVAMGFSNIQASTLINAVGYANSVAVGILIGSGFYTQDEAAAYITTNGNSSIVVSTALVEGQLKEYGITRDTDLSNRAKSSNSFAMGGNSTVNSPGGVAFGIGNTVGDENAPVDGITSIAAGIRNYNKGRAAIVAGIDLKNYASTSAMFGRGKQEYKIDGETDVDKANQHLYLNNLAEAGGDIEGSGDNRVGITGINKGTNSLIAGNEHWNGADNSVIFGNQNIIGKNKNNINGGPCANNFIGNGAINFIDKSESCAELGARNNIQNSNHVNLFGYQLVANGRREKTAIGRYNSDKDNTIFEVGNGTSDTDRKNAFEVLSDGRAKVQSGPVDNDDVVRLLEVSPILSDYVDDALLGG